MLGELEHILLSLGEKLEREEVDILIKECCDPEAGVCGPPPRDVRGLVNVSPTTPSSSKTTCFASSFKQLSVKTTFNYQLQLAVSTTTRTRRQNYQNHQKDADRSRLLLISKFCYVSTLKSGF